MSVRDAQGVRSRIAEKFVQMVCQESYAKIRMVTFAEFCGISRATLYYHFPNKMSIAAFIFDNRLDEILRGRLMHTELVMKRRRSPDDPVLACYARKDLGGHALDTSEFHRALAEMAVESHDFYRGLLSDGKREFLTHLGLRYSLIVEDDIEYMLGSRYLPAYIKSALSASGASAIANSFEYYVAHEDETKRMLEPDGNPFWNTLSESLYGALRAHPMRKGVESPVPSLTQKRGYRGLSGSSGDM